MAKDLASRYRPGMRGKAWLKLKHVLSLDLVVVAADWGYGRRHGWLSNYHLAARDKETGEYLEVGKTFKGPTDQEFQEMTQRLLALESSRRGGTVFVEPRVVVEALFNELQESSQYKSGLALRFARIARVREDKGPLRGRYHSNPAPALRKAVRVQGAFGARIGPFSFQIGDERALIE